MSVEKGLLPRWPRGKILSMKQKNPSARG